MPGRTLIGRVFGIPVHVSGLLLLLLAAVALAGLFGEGGMAVLVVLLLGSVFLHELGHALVARRLGVRVIDIELGPLVCSARMAEIPEDPRIESRIAAAGPAVNLTLALLGLPLMLLLRAPGLRPEALLLVGWLVNVNLILGLFNLLPGFPMDGGRILRSWLARRIGWLEATERAVRVGRVVAIGLALIGLFVFPRAFLLMPLLALYLWFAGTRELWMVRQRHGRSPFGASGPFAFGPMAEAFAAADTELRRARARDAGWAEPARPDVPRSPAERSSEQPSEQRPAAPGGARRPRTVDADALADELREGVDDEQVRRLESYPGRLRRRRRD